MSDTMGYCLNKNCSKFNKLNVGVGHSQSVYRCEKCYSCLSMEDYETKNGIKPRLKINKYPWDAALGDDKSSTTDNT